MKKRIFISLALMLSMMVSYAQNPNGHGNHSGNAQPIPFTIKPHDPLGGHIRPTKSPVQIPEVYLEDSVLYFDAAIEGCTVQLLDEDENVVFADSIEENQTTLTFPSTLTGEFELQIIQDDIIFYCIIEL